MTRDEVLAEDITQFCFMKLWKRRKEIRPDEEFRRLPYVIAPATPSTRRRGG